MTSHAGISTGSADTAQSGIRPDARITAGPSGPTSARVAAVTAVAQSRGVNTTATEAAIATIAASDCSTIGQRSCPRKTHPGSSCAASAGRKTTIPTKAAAEDGSNVVKKVCSVGHSQSRAAISSCSSRGTIRR